jgi:hypothetical protein
MLVLLEPTYMLLKTISFLTEQHPQLITIFDPENIGEE